MLAQTIFADDYRGATVAFGGEIRAEDVAGRAGRPGRSATRPARPG